MAYQPPKHIPNNYLPTINTNKYIQSAVQDPSEISTSFTTSANTFAGKQPIFALQNSGNQTITGNLNVTGNITGGDNLSVTNGITSDNLSVTNGITSDAISTNDLIVGSGKITLSDAAGNQTLEAIGTDLFYDGQLIAKASDLQNISDWADYPAIAQVNINNKGINEATTISFGNNANTLAIDGANNLTYNGEIIETGINGNVADWANFAAVAKIDVDDKGINNAATISLGNNTNTLAFDGANNLTYNGAVINTGEPTAGVTTLNGLNNAVSLTSTGSSVAITEVGNNINLEANAVKTLNGLTSTVNLTSTGSSITITEDGNNINLEANTGGNVASWATYPAVADINLNAKNIFNNNNGFSVTNDRGANVLGASSMTFDANNGAGGNITMNANSGYLGTSFGRINLNANGGNNLGVSTGGTINITSNCPSGGTGVIGGQINIIANTPAGIIPTATAKILTNAAGILSWAGATSPIASAAGINYLHGDLSCNITAGTSPLISDPATVYIYGLNGTLMYGTQYMGRIRPYNDLVTNPSDLRIEKYNNGFTTGYVVLDGVKSIAMESTGAITGVNTINGVAYPPPPAPVYQATYYKTVNQTLNGPNGTGNTDITFDATGAWNNDGGYITHTNGTTNFTVVTSGLYQLEFNANIRGTGVAWTGSKSINIDITRSPIVEQAVIQQSATQNSGTDYGQTVSTTYYLLAGDVINLRINNIYTSITTPFAVGVANTFDLNTFFTWRYISA